MSDLRLNQQGINDEDDRLCDELGVKAQIPLCRLPRDVRRQTRDVPFSLNSITDGEGSGESA